VSLTARNFERQMRDEAAAAAAFELQQQQQAAYEAAAQAQAAQAAQAAQYWPRSSTAPSTASASVHGSYMAEPLRRPNSIVRMNPVDMVASRRSSVDVMSSLQL